MRKTANLSLPPDPQWLLEPHHVLSERQPRGMEVLPHSHLDGMFLLVQEGLMLLHSGGAFTSLAPGRLGWIPPGVQLQARWFGRARGTAMFVRAHACARLPPRTCSWQATALIEALFLRLAQCATLADGHARGLFEVMTEELRLSETERLSLPLPHDERLRDLAHALLAAPDDARGIDAWARAFNMSERTLMRRFRAETGVTLGQWRAQARMLRALELLAQGEPVTQVALAVGYESTSAFIGIFREQFGVTPSRYAASGG
ncbi:AraC family transcriptional regulator [Bordetella hinzii]|nr:AraC family transcriptional regulator [Bordetella hinzii]AKQ53568.1 HTH-type transcriptional repressor of iron proteins A [Bordetella hinzii]AKQ58129.1 HTH-type transcriptional repressor of iron proteins A [Bordetella hinzii]KCB21365.1 DNA-binding helix-turn-helix protein [Bordetella hinzii L60]KCB23194.1 DNA-binding helix-turn-helix protein [Bordetella hinzii OH87 BAL007II]KCB26862.1 DNA-binding helix-turn-helix protein [Bordetella hinzii CA90 BAL1384]